MPVTRFSPQVPEDLTAVVTAHDYDLPYNIIAGKKRILFIHSSNDGCYGGRGIGTAFSGKQRELFNRCVPWISKLFRVQDLMRNFSYLAMNYRYVAAKEHDLDREDISGMNDARIHTAILKFKPDYVVTFGREAFGSVHPLLDETDMNGGTFRASMPWATLMGTLSWARLPTADGGEHWFQCMPTMCLSALTALGRKDRTSHCIGWLMRHLAQVANEGYLVSVPEGLASRIEIRWVDTMVRFEKFMRILWDAEAAEIPIAFDTETDGVRKITTKMVTLQACLEGESIVYILPYLHKDSPFNGDELQVISAQLREFFENAKTEHLYQNGQFDLNILKSNLGFHFYRAPIYDIIAGEVGLDENTSVMSKWWGGRHKGGAFSLGHVVPRYNFWDYETNSFGKGDRQFIYQSDLNRPGMAEYMAYDVVVLHHLKSAQMKLAQIMNYREFKSVVTQIISDQIHMFSTMNQTGMLADQDYLWHLNGPKSELLAAIKRSEEEFSNAPEIAQVEQVIGERSGAPPKGFFGGPNALRKLFDFSKKKHLLALFFDVLGLEPVFYGKDGQTPAIDKAFQDTYEKTVPLVAKYRQRSKLVKLRDAFAVSLLKQLTTNPDAQKDGRVRCNYNYKDVVTGRISASDPGLHQIPTRGEDSKMIKRIFIAGYGWIIIKVDFSAHEVRGLALVSGDVDLGNLFRQCFAVIKAYWDNPTPENKKKIDVDGDPHILNAAYFFGILKELVDKDTRNAVKNVVFGLIYGRGIPSLASSIAKSEEIVTQIVNGFFKRFKKAAAWLDGVKKFARENLYVVSPLGRRRRLWSYLIPEVKGERSSGVQGKYNETDRLAANSPIQGLGSDLAFKATRLLTELVYHKAKHEDGSVPLHVQNMVHDSAVTESQYYFIPQAVKYVRYALTEGVQKRVNKQFGMEFPVNLHIDFEIGASEDSLQKWDGTEHELQRIIYEALLTQQNMLNYATKHGMDAKKEFHQIPWDVLKVNTDVVDQVLAAQQRVKKEIADKDVAKVLRSQLESLKFESDPKQVGTKISAIMSDSTKVTKTAEKKVSVDEIDFSYEEVIEEDEAYEETY